MLSDNHMHTKFSVDSEATPEDMVHSAIKQGMKTICITDHMDKDYYVDGKEWIFDLNHYFKVFSELKEKYKNQIEIRIGIELGLQPHLQKFSEDITKSYSFDYVIGSVHCVDGKDPYYPAFFEGRTDKDAYLETFRTTIENLKQIRDFDVLGHLDYVVRYGTYREKYYSYREFSEEIDEILRYLVENGKGLEVNTGGWKYGLTFAHPHPEILRRYKELGGEIITVGSDAHKPEHVGYDFQKAKELLCANGFIYCTEFRDRKPVFSKIC